MGTTPFEGPDEGPVPIALDALTVKLYVVPGASPLTAAALVPWTVAVAWPGDETTV